MVTYVLKGNVVPKKNSKQICKRGNKTFLRSSDRYMEWNEYAVMALRAQSRGKHFEECKVILKFYYGDKRKRDTDNGVSSVFDTLKDAGIIADDNYFLLPKHYVESYYDKDNPRVEIEIYNLDEVQIIRF